MICPMRMRLLGQGGHTRGRIRTLAWTLSKSDYISYTRPIREGKSTCLLIEGIHPVTMRYVCRYGMYVCMYVGSRRELCVRFSPKTALAVADGCRLVIYIQRKVQQDCVRQKCLANLDSVTLCRGCWLPAASCLLRSVSKLKLKPVVFGTWRSRQISPTRYGVTVDNRPTSLLALIRSRDSTASYLRCAKKRFLCENGWN
ncbi:hypothetical protein F4820DRAFT_86589 [Hypoxylon rubiginosum]|uniref:Uncharacterized protein n=1 Tax=Hypoxylon rubiginosum TaxID=110542 RepID=A0ACB9YNF7_9PEZI|nr:hypothetical protein F4820DRAFT_86589 [Hypoxylon rubiginosum]